MKAQIKMFETIGVLIVFFFLIAVSAIFYISSQGSSIQTQAEEASRGAVLQTALKLLYFPELDCSFAQVKTDNCVDLIKSLEFSKLMRQDEFREEYAEEIGFATVRISSIYPVKETFVLYDNQANDEIGNTKAFLQKYATQSPILIYDAITGTHRFGVIEIEIYGY